MKDLCEGCGWYADVREYKGKKLCKYCLEEIKEMIEDE